MIRTLTHDDFESLHAAFLAAFSDYVVKFALTPEQLAEMLTRRGWVPEALGRRVRGRSAWSRSRSTASKATAPTTPAPASSPPTAAAASAAQLMERSFELLSDRCSTYVLEVLEPNTKAAELYRATRVRESCGRFSAGAYESSSRQVSESQELLLDDSATRAGRLPFDVEPSWQNSTASIARAKAPHVILGDENGYAVVFPDRGDLAQLVVRREARRRGIGTRLLEAAAEAAGKPLVILNVDDSDAGIAAFLEHAGAKRTVRQLEMVRSLQPRQRDARMAQREHTRSRR